MTLQLIDYCNEKWRQVIGYEHLYEVSDMGRIKSLPRMIDNRHGTKSFYAGKILSPTVNKDGYYQVGLTKCGKLKSFMVQGLVLTSFVGPRPHGMLACHGPGGQLDNRLSNLYWGSQLRNTGPDRLRDGTLGKYLTADQVKAIALDRRSYVEIAKDYGVSRCTVSSIKSGKTWRALDAEKYCRAPAKLCGELNASSKLQASQVLLIREDKRTFREIAKEYKVSVSLVNLIKKRRRWAHLP